MEKKNFNEKIKDILQGYSYCVICNKIFTPKRSNSYYCYSNSCQQEIKKQRQRIKDFRKRSVFGHISEYELFTLFNRDKKCVYCSSENKLTIDHILPISRGGTNEFHNLVLCCQSCNSKKSNNNVFDFCRINNISVPQIILNLLINKSDQTTLKDYG